jgi:hypothetical protein
MYNRENKTEFLRLRLFGIGLLVLITICLQIHQGAIASIASVLFICFAFAKMTKITVNEKTLSIHRYYLFAFFPRTFDYTPGITENSIELYNYTDAVSNDYYDDGATGIGCLLAIGSIFIRTRYRGVKLKGPEGKMLIAVSLSEQEYKLVAQLA